MIVIGLALEEGIRIVYEGKYYTLAYRLMSLSTERAKLIV